MKLSKMLPFNLEEILKDIWVKMPKRKSKNSVLSFDEVLSNINDWLADENSENDKILMNCVAKKKKLILAQWGVVRGRTVIWRTWR